MESWYIETSALNYFAKDRTIEDAIATKAHQRLKGRKWVISSITLWEILLTSEEIKKEKLIYFSQNLFDRELLPSPDEIIIEYIKSGFPRVEKPRELLSYTPIANTWRDLVDNPRKTFIYDINDLRNRFNILKPVNKLIHNIINDEDIPLLVNNEESSTNLSLESALNSLKFIKQNDYSNEDKKIFKIAIFYMMLILCAEVLLENTSIKNFWKEIGIKDTFGRMLYSLKHFEPLVYQGPLAALATMIYCQSKKSFSRGIYFDSLHAFYITYVNYFFTNDIHFKNFGEFLKPHPNSYKVLLIRDLEFTSHTRYNVEQRGIIN